MSKRNWKIAIQRLFNLMGFQVNKIRESKFDPFFVQKKLITISEPVIFDVGAHFGESVQRYKARFPQATLYCFEPSPASYQTLLHATEADDRVFCYETAIAQRPGTVNFYENQNSFTDSLLALEDESNKNWGQNLYHPKSQVEVKMTSLDDFCTKENITQIDILKIDVQGGEFDVLKGAETLLESQAISVIYAEIIIRPTYQGQHHLHDYFALLSSLGYEFIDFYNYVRSGRRLNQVDVIFATPAILTESDYFKVAYEIEK
jgi:FkbM family methyltransferase